MEELDLIRRKAVQIISEEDLEKKLKSGKKLTINAGYSHPVKLAIPTGIKVEAVSNTELTISGCDKILVGEFAANVRKVRSPEPYKGKGIRYKDEHVRRKEGKKAAK